MNDDIQHLTPPSEEIRLRDEDSDWEEDKRKSDLIKRIKPKSSAPLNTESGKRVSVTRKVAADKSQNTARDKKKIINYGQEEIRNSNLNSGFSSCEFHSIDEFSLEQSTVINKKANFEMNCKPTIPSKGINGQPVQLFEYKPTFRDDKRSRDRAIRMRESNRRVINVEPQFKDSKVSYIFKDVSSYDKSVEMPSSYLEPSIIFDEKEGRGGFLNINRTTKWKFKPHQTKYSEQSPVCELKIIDWIQINQKSNEQDSPIEISFADSQSNEDTLFNADSKNINSSSNSNKDKVTDNLHNSIGKSSNKKHKLKDYITQFEENADIFGYKGSSHKKQTVKESWSENKIKPVQKHDQKLNSKGKEHGSTGGVDSSQTISDDEATGHHNIIDGFEGKELDANEMKISDDTEQEADNNPNFSDVHKMHMIQTLQGLLFIRSLPKVSQEVIKNKQIFLPPPNNPAKKKVIVFDLDETLVHWIEDFDPSEVDHVLRIEFPNNEVVDAGLNIRPFAIECLKEANKHFQVVVFTASHSWYADAVLDFIDPKRELIQYRMYRDQCVETPQGIFIKDLRVIANRSLKDLLLVDNASYSFGYQLDNGIPIIPFYNDKEDRELLHLIQYLKWVVDSEDVREQNRKAFQLGELTEQEISEYLNLYASNDNDDSENEGESNEESK